MVSLLQRFQVGTTDLSHRWSGSLLAGWQSLSFCFNPFHLSTVTWPPPWHCLFGCPSCCQFSGLTVCIRPQGAGTILLSMPHLHKRPLTPKLPTGSCSHSSWLPLTHPSLLLLFPVTHWEILSALSDQIFQKGFLDQSCGACKDEALCSPSLSLTERPGIPGSRRVVSEWACEGLNPHPEPKCQPLLLSSPHVTGFFP